MAVSPIQIVENPVSPGQCRICGVPFGKRPLVDTGLSADACNLPHWDDEGKDWTNNFSPENAGAVYICSECVVNMGMAIGMLSAEKVKELNQELAEYVSEKINLEVVVRQLESILDGYGIPRDIKFDPRKYNSSAAVLQTPSYESSSAIGSSGDGNSTSEEFNVASGSGDSTINESSDQQRSDDVPTDSNAESGKQPEPTGSESQFGDIGI